MGTFDDANVDKDLLSQIFADEGDDAETDALLNEMLSDEKEDTNTSEDDVLKDLLSDDNDTEETSETDTPEENSEEETQDAVPQDTMEETVEVPAVEEDVPEESVAEPEAKEEKDYIDGYNLDVDKLVFGEILISMPGKTLCKEDCKGICLICGANLNKGECGCDRDILDPRMSVFKDILKNFKEV